METVNPIITKYDELIKTSMKAREKEKLNTYKLIKAKVLEFKTQKNAPELNEAAEIQILNKMVKVLQGDIEDRKKANRLEQIPEFEAQLKYVQELLPKAASEDDIKSVVEKYISDNGNYTQKEIGKVIGYIKKTFNNVDGSMMTRIVKSYIN